MIAENVAIALGNTTFGRRLLIIPALILSFFNLAAAEKMAAAASLEAGTEAIFEESAFAPLIALTVGIAGIGVAVGVVVAAVNAHSEAEKCRKEALQASIDASNGAFETIKKNAATLNELHKEYKTTGKASDEFKNALLEQAEALGIVNAKQMIALGQYDELKKNIDEATQKQLNYNISLLQKQNIELGGNTGSVTGISYVMNGGYEYVEQSTNSAYQNILQKQDVIKNKQDEIIEKQNELTEVTLKTVDEKYTQGQKNDDILRIQEELNRLRKEELSLTENITENDKKVLENTEKIRENQLTAALNNADLIGNIVNAKDVRTILENGSLGPELTE